MKQLGVIVAIAIVLAAQLPSQASAHVLASDGSIGAVLHIQPDDNPQSGAETTYVLAFNDASNRLRLDDCGCTVTVRGGGKTVARKPLDISHGLKSVNSYTFPKPAVYTLTVVGAPKTSDAFQPFSITYTVRVTGEHDQQAQKVPPLLWAGMGLLLGFVLLAAYAGQLSYTNRQQTKQERQHAPKSTRRRR